MHWSRKRVRIWILALGVVINICIQFLNIPVLKKTNLFGVVTHSHSHSLSQNLIGNGRVATFFSLSVYRVYDKNVVIQVVSSYSQMSLFYYI